MTANDIFDRTSSVLSANRVFAPAETRDGITVIPAAAVRGGGGGDAGRGGDTGRGDSGGFGMSATPAGALVVDGQDVRWKVPFDLNRAILGGQIVGIAFFLFGWLGERAKARAAIKIAKINAAASTR